MTREERVAQYVKRVIGKRSIEELKLSEPITEGMPASAGLELPGGAPEKLMNAANTGLESVASGKTLTAAEIAGLEAIINAKERPAIPLESADFTISHPVWAHLATPETRSRIWSWQKSIGRIEVKGIDAPYGGTGFVVGQNRLMTNRHVAELFASGLGDKRVSFIDGVTPGFNLAFSPDRGQGVMLRVASVKLIHPYWDMAVLEVEGLPADAAPLLLSPKDAADYLDREVVAIGYPASDRRNDAGDQQLVFKGVFYVKQLQPGRLGGREDVSSFKKIVSSVGHDCSTLGGNSGSAVIDVKDGAIVGLHFAGRYLIGNYAAPMCELAKDGRVRDAGVLFDGAGPAMSQTPWQSWWTGSDAEERANPTNEKRDAMPATSAPKPAVQTAAAQPQAAQPRVIDGAVHLTVPLHITIRLGDTTHLAATMHEAAQAAGEDLVEKMVEPQHDVNYGSRKGYDPHFLGVNVPMPEPADKSVLVKTPSGDSLDYQNFSIKLHAARHLAIVAASNLTTESKLKKPDPAKNYSRKALTGLGPNDQERWFADNRIGAQLQLPDIFYTNDDGSFDKGHIVRREDVTWGQTYEDVVRANGDTYHVTNCSPQVAGFNRSANGKDNWGDLENSVFSQAASERLTILAGPVLAHDDPRFLGRFGGKTRAVVQIPVKFWKVIIARTEEGIGAYGFVLEQDLSDVDTSEFAVPENFLPSMRPLSAIAEMAGIAFAPEVFAADQFDDRGVEVARRAGVKRKRR
ncbi:DNA/RNA non-specific endonuclease [Methylocystis sp. H62]|uniref:DNA/RNA non-specific endonuclease n=1 Tax=Methylocystis sp. H62 TaxID=2785789 RepID=UPI0018C2EAA7|nr:DNA/RNA non-specific endonuclease [Methylocystis sp. H62]MBG0793184.1 DNA/RNA non-specific endonuclease [Methylocystis sp. H62]